MAVRRNKSRCESRDLDPGYLNRQSLLGEHRELHGIVSILVNGKKGYCKHPETLRWIGYGWALKQRHRLLAAEMALRGYCDKSPVSLNANDGEWPKTYVDEPFVQLRILTAKYQHKEPSRIPLPENPQQLWGQHTYSILARDVNLYKQLGREVSGINRPEYFPELTLRLVEALRKRPSPGGIRNAL